MRNRGLIVSMVVCATLVGPAGLQHCRAATLEVGPGKRFQRIEEANAQAQPGDVILVYPLANDQPYQQTAVLVRQRQLTFRGVPNDGSRWVKISGKGFNYSGRGSVPRAIFQFDPGADGCVLERLELTDAHNGSHNGAGVRINQANQVSIRRCSIHDNDMGIMSNGNGTLQSAVDQRIEHCEIHHNGNYEAPGYNHNLYLGGTSVTLSFCDIHHSLTGHNVKSRAHRTCVKYCYVHDSRNREFDLVDAAETVFPDSHAVLMGNIIVKDPEGRGNRAVIHFGQDGGREHDGTVHLIFNTIVSPFIGPVVDLSAAKAKAHLVGNLVSDGGRRQSGQVIGNFRNGATPQSLSGTPNWFDGDFGGVGRTSLDRDSNIFRRAGVPLFVNAAEHDYRLAPEVFGSASVALSIEDIRLPAIASKPEANNEYPLAWQYRHPLDKEKRPLEPRLTLGAYAAGRQ